MRLSLKVTRKLSIEIGPRPPGSQQEKEAAVYLQETFQAKGLTSKVTPFPSLRTFSLSYGLFYGISIASVFLYLVAPWPAIAGASAVLILFIADINTFRIFGSLLNFWRSHNVIATIPASEMSRRSIVFSAHLDSSRSGIMFYPPIVYFFRMIYLGGLLSLLLIPVLLAVSHVTDTHLFWKISLLPAFFLISGIIMLLQREIWGRYTAGANDNASAVGVLVEIAENFALQPLKNCDLWFVGTGSEESGIIGMADFLKKHLNQLKDPLFINLESLGCGKLYYVEQEGMFPTRKADHFLTNLAREISEKNKLPFKAGRFQTILTDNVAVLARKLPGITLMGCGQRQLIPHWHQYTDVFDNIDAENLGYAVSLASEMARAIDKRIEEVS